eukprot:COSAG04_NODE_9833_length_828_cov_1.495199_1_plen_197_part_00
MHKAGEQEFFRAVVPTQLALAEQNAVQRRTVSSTLQLEGIRGHSESTPAPKMFPGYKSSPPEHHLMPAFQRKIADRISEMPFRESTKLPAQQARKSSKARGNMQPRMKSFHGEGLERRNRELRTSSLDIRLVAGVVLAGPCECPLVDVYVAEELALDRVLVPRAQRCVCTPTPSYFIFTSLQNGPSLPKRGKRNRG